MRKTIRQYKEEIKELEAQYYERLSSTDLEKVDDVFTKEMEYIDKLKPNTRSKKIEYVRYYRELKYVMDWDISTAEGQRKATESEEKAYKTFIKNFNKQFGDITYDEWRDLVETFGSAGQAVMEQFYRGGQGGNGDLLRVFKDVKNSKELTEKGIGNNDIGKAMLKVYRASLKDDFPYKKTPTGLLDALRDEIGLIS